MLTERSAGRPNRRTPPDYEPLGNGWSATFGGDTHVVVIAYVGTQRRRGAVADHLGAVVRG